MIRIISKWWHFRRRRHRRLQRRHQPAGFAAHGERCCGSGRRLVENLEGILAVRRRQEFSGINSMSWWRITRPGTEETNASEGNTL